MTKITLNILISFIISFQCVYCNINTDETNNFQIISKNEWRASSSTGEINNLQLPVKVLVIIHTASSFCNTQVS